MAFTRASINPTVLGGTYRLVSAKVTPDAATGSIVFSEFGTVDAIVGCQFAATLTSTCYTIDAKINGGTANQVDFELWAAGGSAATSTFLAFWVTVLCH